MSCEAWSLSTTHLMQYRTLEGNAEATHKDTLFTWALPSRSIAENVRQL